MMQEALAHSRSHERRRQKKSDAAATIIIGDPTAIRSQLISISRYGHQRECDDSATFHDAELPPISYIKGAAMTRKDSCNDIRSVVPNTSRCHRPRRRMLCMTALFKLYSLWVYTISQHSSHGLVLSSTKVPNRRRGAENVSLTLFPSKTGMSPQPSTRDCAPSARAYSSPLFINQHQRIQRRQSVHQHRRQSSTALPMVLTTPESIIEQASTINLLDDLIDESVRTSARRPIMMQFDPSSGWIWRRWTGTVFAETWTSMVRNMVYALVVFFLQRSYPAINKNLSGFGTLWGQLLSITTFTLTFFVNQSYSLWRKCMELSRRLQGRLHDVNMNLATHAARKVPSNPNEKSTYTASSRQILELMSRYVRLFNLLTYASFTRSHRPILTPRGMRRLVERGLMTATEREVLVDAAIPATQRHSVVLMWMIRLFVEGREAGHIQGGAGFESETMHKFHVIRCQYGAIGDELQGRMPLAYTHIVQVLVDLILWMFPIMAFSTGMSPLLVVVGTGLLTISYQGLFDLAKQFLDPYDNENYGRGEDPLCVDTLIAETNAGSVRWLYGFEEMPYAAQKVADGEMYEYLLPVRGYSVEELAQMEEERIEREKQLEEQRKREEEESAERLRKEAEEMEKAAEAEATELVDDETPLPVMQELIEGLSIQSSIALENTNTTKTRNKRTKIKSIASLGNKTKVLEETDLLTTAAVDSTQNETSMMKDQKTNITTSKKATKESARNVHKVTTLANGKPVKFMPSDTVKKVVEQPVPSDMQSTNYLATLSNGDSTKKPIKEGRNYVPDLIDIQSTEDLPLFNKTGRDGPDLRLSQQLADDSWLEEEEEIETKVITLEEYKERLREAQNELQETFEILSASPGAEGNERLYTVKEKKKKINPTYDQTRLDGISQLWDLPPEDPSSLGELEPPEKVDDIEFEAVSQLWGGAVSSKSDSRRKSNTADTEVVGMESFAGISELWEGNLEDFNDGGESDVRFTNNASSKVHSDGDADLEEVGSFSGLPWHKEKGKDGKEYRLSQMLADEEWDEDTEAEEAMPMTLEDYNKQVEEILTQAEEEMRETEAILLSKPGTDPLGWDYDEEQLAPMSEDGDEVAEDVKDTVTSVEQLDENDDLAALEMDMEDDVESYSPELEVVDEEADHINDSVQSFD